MRTFESPYIADWFVISLRWSVLVGVLVSLALGGGLSLASGWPLILLLIWNVAMTFLASVNIRLTYHRQVNLVVDVLLTALFFHLQHGLMGSAWWVFILPVLTGAVYFEFWGAFGVSILFTVIMLISTLALTRSAAELLTWPVLVYIGGALGLGALFGKLGQRLAVHLHAARERHLREDERKAHIEGERMRAIYELTSTLTATLSYKRVLDSALDLGYTALNPDPEVADGGQLVSAVLLFKGDKLRIGSARRFTNADLKVSLPGAEGLLKKVFDEGEPLLSTAVATDPELSHIIALRSCMSAYLFPLRSGFNVYGLMLFAHPGLNYFTRDRVDMLDIIGRQAVVAIQNARLYQDLVEEKNRMVEVHEEARKKLARDLHDGPTQSVSAMAMRINLARRMLDRNPASAAAELVKLEDLAHRTTKEIRHMLFTLRPLILESQGLGAALQAMAEKMRETYSQNVVINVETRLAEKLEMGKQGVIFYIVEEAVNNARKHANARSINVRLGQVETGIALLEIVDDGVGFDVAAVDKAYDKRGSLGMVNLRERTELVNGLLNIDSEIGRGTRVQVYIPMTEEAADRMHHKK